MSVNELLAENRALGFACAETAPEPYRSRILEIRSALVAKKPVPAPSREFIIGAEQRSAALSFSQRLFPNRNETLRAKADRLGAIIFADHVKAHAHEIILADWAKRLHAANLRAGFALSVEAPGPRSEDGGQVSEGGTPSLRCKAKTAAEHRAAAERHRVIAQRSYTSARSADLHYTAQDLHNALADAIDDNLDDEDFNDRCSAACRASFMQESA
jgi:hypothetical protein